MELFWIISFSLLSLSFAQIKENETLIYHWDVHHKIYYYCQFGTQKEIENGNFEIQCLKRNKGMQHFLPGGVPTFPYLSYGSQIGFVLQCTDIPNAELLDCRKYVYSWCTYTCKSSSHVKKMQCQLTGPVNNVTAVWSEADPCPESSHSKSFLPESQVKEDSLSTSTEQIYAADVTSITADSPAYNNTTTTVTPGVATIEDNLQIIVYIVSGCVTFVVVLLIVLLLYWCWRKGLICWSKSKSTFLNMFHSKDEPDMYEIVHSYNVIYNAKPPSEHVPLEVPLDEAPPLSPSPSAPNYVSYTNTAESPAEDVYNPASVNEAPPSSPNASIKNNVYYNNTDRSLRPESGSVDTKDSSAEFDKKLQKALIEMESLPPDLDDIKVGPDDPLLALTDLEMALDDFVPFSVWSSFGKYDKSIKS